MCNFPNCASSFGTRYNLRRHIEARHLGIKKFACDICGLKLASKQTKQEHMYTHTGEKPLVCTYPGCSKPFRQSSQLSVHVKQHHQLLIDGSKSANVVRAVGYDRVRWWLDRVRGNPHDLGYRVNGTADNSLAHANDDGFGLAIGSLCRHSHHRAQVNDGND